MHEMAEAVWVYEVPGPSREVGNWEAGQRMEWPVAEAWPVRFIGFTHPVFIQAAGRTMPVVSVEAKERVGSGATRGVV